MISKEVVQQLVDRWLEGKDYFLADLAISADDRILVEIDHEEGVWIEDCVALSRFIEDGLDRDAADFELEVGSAGIGQPFKVLRQYEIHIGDDVEVLIADGRKLIGRLDSADADTIAVVTLEKVKAPGEKRPHIQEVRTEIPMSQVKWTKLHIDFK
ncbi:ribosome assembly cofactor RimP [Alloprevotella sp. OH1205_COT-284]|uniref:ribosome assembly cofactor RimP n=1 Tax=Alloprevotella sp. OH1205_COT-284 TaxID=2491043 RepID=UPI000F5F14A7|nr:ribosome assembly cofactor RimP [Alloprevotella sp. OH1205_COT-284]RRD79931.1 ribosome assembly cofactor RimP [Alloprevotella sp. OH1205_COT-284]